MVPGPGLEREGGRTELVERIDYFSSVYATTVGSERVWFGCRRRGFQHPITKTCRTLVLGNAANLLSLQGVMDEM